MTPFDPDALLAMLLAFYPQPGAAALRLARAERPEYFAGGEIIGTSGDALRLPDGRIFDLIFDVDGLIGGPRWQVIVPGPSTYDPNAIVLVPGPLVPIDIDQQAPTWIEPFNRETVVPWIAWVEQHAQAIDGQHAIVAGALDSGALQSTFSDHVEGGERTLYNELAALPAIDPGGVVQATDDRGGVISNAQTDYPNPEQSAPPEITVNPNPIDRPPNEGEGSPWYQQ